MYTPEPFKVTDENVIEKFIADHPFAQLISTQSGKIEVTHLPINRFSDGKLYGHIAHANGQSSLESDEEVCLVFSGPHAYISPDYYESEFNVPTWNYSAVHMYGKITFIENEKRVWKLLQELTEIYEGTSGWKLPDEERYKSLTGYLKFFEFVPISVEAKFKFNQNKTDEDKKAVMEALREKGQSEAAEFMALL